MATVETPRYGVEITYTNGLKTTMWRATEQARDRVQRDMNQDKNVRTAKAVNR